MKKDTIRKHLRAYSIYNRRRTTINHAFASAIAYIGEYDETEMSEALKGLGQDPESDLICVYCDEKLAETWDHIFALVKNNEYSGYGHTIGNLLPCCKECNSKKGNKNWLQFISENYGDNERKQFKINQINNYINSYLDTFPTIDDMKKICPSKVKEYDEIKEQILSFMKKADGIADEIRNQVILAKLSRANARTHEFMR